MKVKDIKVEEYYWDSLHDNYVYCVKVFDGGNEEDSYIESLAFDGKFIRKVFLQTCFVDPPVQENIGEYIKIKDKTITLESGEMVPKDEFIGDNGFPEGTIVVLPGEGLGVVYNYENHVNEMYVLAVSGGILTDTCYTPHMDPVLKADDYFKSKFKKMLEKKGFYYDEKFKLIFKVGDLKSNFLKYLNLPKFWSKNIASTITGGFTGKVVPEESGYFDTTLISVTSDGMSSIKIKFKTSDLRVSTEEEIEKFEDKIKRASEDAKKEIESVG